MEIKQYKYITNGLKICAHLLKRLKLFKYLKTNVENQQILFFAYVYWVNFFALLFVNASEERVLIDIIEFFFYFEKSKIKQMYTVNLQNYGSLTRFNLTIFFRKQLGIYDTDLFK